MRRTTFLSLALVVGVPLALAAPAFACDAMLSPGSDLQSAIHEVRPGGTVCLTGGVHPLRSTLILNRPVTLQGPGCGVDPRPSAGGRRSGHAVLDGPGLDVLVSIEADNVTICGLELMRAGDVIATHENRPVSGVVIKDSVIHDAEDDAVQLRNCDGCRVENNFIYATKGDGINLCCGSNGGVVEGNELEDIDSVNAAIYLYGPGERHRVARNVVHGTRNDGIKVGESNCRGRYVTDTVVESNRVFDVEQDGITVYSPQTQVIGNEVRQSSSMHGAVYVACATTRDVLIKGNFLTQNRGGIRPDFGPTFAIRVGPRGGSHNTPDGRSIRIEENCLVDNAGGIVNTDGGAVVNATGNAWADDGGVTGRYAVEGSIDAGGSGGSELCERVRRALATP